MKLRAIIFVGFVLFLGVSAQYESEVDVTDNTLRCASSLCEKKGTQCSRAWGFDIWNDEQTLDRVASQHCVRDNGKSGESIFCCEAGSDEGKIIKALGAQPNEYPAMAFLTSTAYVPGTNNKKTKGGNCGGTVYNENYIITAAHCVLTHFETMNKTKLAHKMTVRLASNHVLGHPDEDMLYYSTGENIMVHEDYNPLVPGPIVNDIAIIKLDTPIKDSVMGKKVQAIRIADKDEKPKEEREPRALIMGYGKTDLNKTLGALLAGPLPLSFPGDEDCDKTTYPEGPGREAVKFQNICAGGKGYGAASSGDSGGPAICMDKNDMPYLCGVTSFVNANCVTQLGGKCDELLPSAFVNVAYFHDWLLLKTEGEEQRDEQIMKKMKRDFRKLPMVKTPKGLKTTKPPKRRTRSRHPRDTR